MSRGAFRLLSSTGLLSHERERSLEWKGVELERITVEVILAISNTELNRFLLLGDVEGAEEVVPDREDKSVVFVPMTFCLAVMNLVLGGANKDRAQEGPVREPNMGVPQVIAGKKEEVGGDSDPIDRVEGDRGRNEEPSQSVGGAR